MADYGLSDALPKLTEEKKKEVLGRLKELGVEEYGDLKVIKDDDLTDDGLLTIVQARKLVKLWKEGKFLPVAVKDLLTG